MPVDRDPLASEKKKRENAGVMTTLSFRGCFTALVTPFTADGEAIDGEAYDKHLERQIAAGVSGLVPCGTTGESPTLTDQEQLELVRRTVEVAKGRVPVIAGTGTNSTKKSVQASRAAVDAGADAVMIVMPYYNKPSQAGLAMHVETIARSVDVPVVLYNIPGRSVVELGLDTLGQLLERCDNVVAIKDATNNVHYCQRAVSRFGDRLAVLSGDDAITMPLMSVGATGVISVTANLYPTEVAQVTRAMLEGDVATARERHFRLLDVHAALFIEPNPVPAKAALAARGHMHSTVRPPLVPASDENRQRVERALAAFEGR